LQHPHAAMAAHTGMQVCLLLVVVLFAFVSSHDVSSSCEHAEGSTPGQSCAAAVEEKQASALLQISSGVRSIEHRDHLGQEKSAVSTSKMEPYMLSMIRPEQWVCSMIPRGDERAKTCEVGAQSLLAISEPNLKMCENGCGVEQANAYRTMSWIGSLPCCRTAPFCAAPACHQHPLPPAQPATCTKRTPQQNVAYMTLQETWPGYHGHGGAFELDTLKYLDLLACHGRPDCSEKSFDLMIDLGANTGYFSEKVSVRRFAKDYIMIEANPLTTQVLRNRWGNTSFKQAWFTQQVAQKKEDQVPEFEIMAQALSYRSGGYLDMCQTEESMRYADGCNVSIASIDSLIPTKLTTGFQEKLAKAQSAFIKIDTEGMDELVLRGMKGLLGQQRGTYADGKPRHLVNFLQFEYSPALMKKAREREDFQHYDLKTTTQFLESIGFETFLIGPRFLPLSHGSWDDVFKTWTEDPDNNAGKLKNYPTFDSRLCSWCPTMETEPSFTTDIFVMRSSHPRAAEIKVALGACEESKDFDINDTQYAAAR